MRASSSRRADVGEVERVANRAEAAFADRVRRLQPASALYYLDMLRTGPEARRSARLEDVSVVTMGENAELAIEEFVYAAGEIGSLSAPKTWGQGKVARALAMVALQE